VNGAPLRLYVGVSLAVAGRHLTALGSILQDDIDDAGNASLPYCASAPSHSTSIHQC
jgi:hypothetical protein